MEEHAKLNASHLQNEMTEKTSKIAQVAQQDHGLIEEITNKKHLVSNLQVKKTILMYGIALSILIIAFFFVIGSTETTKLGSRTGI